MPTAIAPASPAQPEPRPGETWRHYKGGLYAVIGVGRHSETEERLVVYRSHDGGIWVRPLAMWLESVDGRPRFALLTEAT